MRLSGLNYLSGKIFLRCYGIKIGNKGKQIRELGEGGVKAILHNIL